MASNIGNMLTGFGDMHGPDDPGGWVILDEPELHLGADVLVPDLAGWRIERATWPEDAAYIDIAPDWVCEVLAVRGRLASAPGRRAIEDRCAWWRRPSRSAVSTFGAHGGEASANPYRLVSERTSTFGTEMARKTSNKISVPSGIRTGGGLASRKSPKTSRKRALFGGDRSAFGW
ncbi:MAG: hypothetical protein U0165_03605 [Polyangiaceae bacterium]